MNISRDSPLWLICISKQEGRYIYSMKKSILKLHRTFDGAWHSAILNNHGRRIYIKLNSNDNGLITIRECFYIDRPWRPEPLRHHTKSCKEGELLSVFATELDKKFCKIEFVEDGELLSTEQYIKYALQNKRKIKFLILVLSGDVIKTRLKNLTHRVIFLEIKRNGNTAYVHNCHYCDRLYKRDNSLITPASLCTIRFDYSLDAILKIANDELNCDFTDVIITSDTFGFDKTRFPICGSI